MKRVFALCLAASMLLCGCAALFDGNYVSTTPHQEQGGLSDENNVQAEKYDELLSALISLAERGSKSGIIHVPKYDPDQVDADMKRAANVTISTNPIAAYAVEEITWELGTNSGQRAVAVSISYIHDRAEILKIRRVTNVEEAAKMVYKELEESSTGVVLYLENYNKTDFVQMVEEYAFDNPQIVMETPQVTENIYPKSGSSRVVELKFTYQNNRESLRILKSQVTPVFASSKYRVTPEATARENFSQLYSFLMERGFGEYTIEASNTPAYSLLWHGAGDSKAFATVYAAICRQSGLDCRVITGTRQGEPWYWNLVNLDGKYYHLDLLRCHELGGFQEQTDGKMSEYIWDYSAYPASPDDTEPPVDTTDPTGTAPAETQPK